MMDQTFKFPQKDASAPGENMEEFAGFMKSVEMASLAGFYDAPSKLGEFHPKGDLMDSPKSEIDKPHYIGEEQGGDVGEKPLFKSLSEKEFHINPDYYSKLFLLDISGKSLSEIEKDDQLVEAYDQRNIGRDALRLRRAIKFGNLPDSVIDHLSKKFAELKAAEFEDRTGSEMKKSEIEKLEKLANKSIRRSDLGGNSRDYNETSRISFK